MKHTQWRDAVRAGWQVGVGAFALACGMAQGANIAWDGGPSGSGTSWHTGANWVGDGKPGAADTAVISIASADVVVTGSEMLAALLMGGTAYTGPQNLTIRSGTFAPTNNAVSYIGQQRATCSRVRQEGGTVIFGGPGTTAPGQHLFLGGYRNAAYGGTGIWELVSGTLRVDRTRNIYLGYTGAGAMGVLNQTGGTVELGSNDLLIAQGTGTSGLYLMTGGTNTVDVTAVGSYGMGVVTQTMGLVDGLACVSGSLTIGVQSGSAGAYVLSGGTLRMKTVTLSSNGGYGRFIQTGGVFTNAGGFVMGDNAANARAEATLSGGQFYAGGTLSLGSAGTGTWTQASADVRVGEIRIGNYATGRLRIDNGSLSVAGLLRIAMYGASEGTLEVRGGSISVGSDVAGSGIGGGKRRLHVVGSACTGFMVGGGFNLAEGTGASWRIDLDDTPSGITRIDAANSSTIAGCALEVAVQEGVTRRVGEAFELLRIPQARALTTTGVTLTSLTEGYDFDWSVAQNDGGYDKLIITCTQAPTPPAGGTVMLIQ